MVENIVCSQCGELRPKYCRGICSICYDRNRTRKKRDTSPIIDCIYCGKKIASITTRGESRNCCKGCKMTGERSKFWKGGVRHDKDDYIYIKSPNHPYKDNNGYVPQHRLVYEHYLTIMTDQPVFLPFPEYEIHHLDENVENNSLMNLELVTHKEHRGLHKVDMSGRYCSYEGCKEPNRRYYNKRQEEVWRKNPDKLGYFVHEKCFDKIMRNKKRFGG